jgi:hypothetical protein
MSRSAAVATCILALTAFSCSTKPESRDVIARVGNREITMQELRRAYTLNPAWHKNQTMLESYLTQLSELEREKLFALEAERQGLDRDTLLRSYFGFLRSKELIKGLYRREVEEKLRITEEDERIMYALRKKTVDAEYVLARDSITCAMYARILEGTPAARITLPPDSSVRAGTRSRMTVGSIPPPFEQGLMNGGVNEMVGPKRFGDVYMVMKVVGFSRNAFMSENEFQSEREKIHRFIRDRRVDTLARAYVVKVMKDSGLKLNPDVFWPLAEYFGRRVADKSAAPKQSASVAVTTDELLAVEGDVRGLAQRVVASHREGSLTVWDFVSQLSSMPGTMRPPVRTPQELKEAIAWVVRNQYFAREAERQGLGSDPDVMADFSQQRDEGLSTAYYRARRAQVTVSPDEVDRFRRASGLAENGVVARFNMTALAIDAKTDSLLRTELAGLTQRYPVAIDTAKIRAMLPGADDRIHDDPVPMTVREIFQ